MINNRIIMSLKPQYYQVNIAFDLSMMYCLYRLIQIYRVNGDDTKQFATLFYLGMARTGYFLYEYSHWVKFFGQKIYRAFVRGLSITNGHMLFNYLVVFSVTWTIFMYLQAKKNRSPSTMIGMSGLLMLILIWRISHQYKKPEAIGMINEWILKNDKIDYQEIISVIGSNDPKVIVEHVLSKYPEIIPWIKSKLNDQIDVIKQSDIYQNNKSAFNDKLMTGDKLIKDTINNNDKDKIPEQLRHQIITIAQNHIDYPKHNN